MSSVYKNMLTSDLKNEYKKLYEEEKNRRFYHEKLAWIGVLGTLVALIGVAEVLKHGLHGKEFMLIMVGGFIGYYFYQNENKRLNCCARLRSILTELSNN